METPYRPLVAVERERGSHRSRSPASRASGDSAKTTGNSAVMLLNVDSSGSTRGADYTRGLLRLEGAWWKQALHVQLPYRWNVRRLFGQREVLEVGCGIGRNLKHLAPRAVGVDHNEHSIQVARARGLTALSTDEFPQSPYAEAGRFGGLLAAHVLDLMARAEAVELLGEYLPYLAPDALVVLICPQERGYPIDKMHVEFADFADMVNICEKLGLIVRRRFSFPFPRPVGRIFPYNEFVVVASTPVPQGTVLP